MFPEPNYRNPPDSYWKIYKELTRVFTFWLLYLHDIITYYTLIYIVIISKVMIISLFCRISTSSHVQGRLIMTESIIKSLFETEKIILLSYFKECMKFNTNLYWLVSRAESIILIVKYISIRKWGHDVYFDLWSEKILTLVVCKLFLDDEASMRMFTEKIDSNTRQVA